jgi:hypothetical protein
MIWKILGPFLLSFVFLLFGARPVLSSVNPLDNLLHPFQSLEIPNFYDLNHSWIDFFIFLCLFVSVAKLTIGRRFQGRDGRILSVVVGLVLSLSLSLAEMKMGFSIGSFGPIAAAIVIFLMGLVIFYLIRSVGAGFGPAGSLAFIITYFLIRATAPNFFLWIEENQWTGFVHLGLVVALIISFWKVISAFLSKGKMESWGRSLERSHDQNLDLKPNIDQEKNEKSLIKSRLEKITKKGVKNGKEIVEDLKEMLKIIDEFGDTDRGRHLVSEKIRDIASRENLILNQLGSLKEISARIESFDLKAFKDLKARWDKVPDKEKGIVREEIQIEKDKILSEEKLREMEAEVMRYDKDFRYSLNMAVASLRSNQPNQARDWVLKAIKAEEEAVNILKEMKSLEDRLLKLTKMEFRTLRKEAKEER